MLSLRVPKRFLAVPSIIVLTAFISALFLLFLYHPEDGFLHPYIPDRLKGPNHHGGYGHDEPAGASMPPHPIDDLIKLAQFRFGHQLWATSETLEDAAMRYRQRRGRHPPPGFDQWFAAARRMKAVVVEDFFDRIYHDINPFWALKPRDMRVKTHKQVFMVRVRNGRVEGSADLKELPLRIREYVKLVKEMMPHLPDLDLVINPMDESRVLVPWETINEYVAEELRNRTLIRPEDAISEYSGLADVNDVTEPYDPHWISGQTAIYWDHLRATCPPDSPARNFSSLPSFDIPIEYPLEPMPYTYHGYVQNFTASQDPCLQPHLRGMHGTFIDSVSMSTTHELFPMFGECKLPQNNEILLPGAMYLAEDVTRYSGGNYHGGAWGKKKDGLIWRGVASGARTKAENWWHIHRHRFIQMMNGTTLSAVEAGDATQAPTFRLLPSETYNIPAQKRGELGDWISSFSDVGFIDFLCDPPDFEGKKALKTCWFMNPFMSITKTVPMKAQYDYKYLPDVDGNSFSGRWRAFLLSTSMPLKSTIYTEWHDDRLIPWVHFVPFDNSYMDIYGVMDYFLHGHDAQAEKIAKDGKIWAEKVLRREDMLLYTWRLLLEYARVVDDNRDRLAFVDDLKA